MDASTGKHNPPEEDGPTECHNNPEGALNVQKTCQTASCTIEQISSQNQDVGARKVKRTYEIGSSVSSPGLTAGMIVIQISK